jgi:hypothetical protein
MKRWAWDSVRAIAAVRSWSIVRGHDFHLGLVRSRKSCCPEISTRNVDSFFVIASAERMVPQS